MRARNYIAIAALALVAACGPVAQDAAPNARAGNSDQQALADFDRTLAQNPNSVAALLGRAVVLNRMRDYERVLQDLNRAQQLEPDNASPYYTRATYYAARGELAQAIRDFDRAIQLKPNNPSYWYGRALAYERSRDYVRAVQDFDETIRLSPRFGSAYNGRGIANRRLGNFDRAISDLARAVELDPKSYVTYYSRGQAYAAVDDYVRAIADYDQAISINPSYANSYWERGYVETYLGHFRAAHADFERAFELGLRSIYGVLFDHVALVRDGRAAESRLRDRIVNLDTSSWPAPVVRYFIGQISVDDVLTAAKDSDPKVEREHLCEAYYYLGVQALARNERVEAVRLFRLALGTGVTTFQEYKAARAEMTRLAQ